MMTREQMKQLWKHIAEHFPDELEDACNDFEFNAFRMEHVDAFTDDDVSEISMELMYMLVEGVYDGQFDDMYATLTESLGFSEALADELLAW